MSSSYASVISVLSLHWTSGCSASCCSIRESAFDVVSVPPNRIDLSGGLDDSSIKMIKLHTLSVPSALPRPSGCRSALRDRISVQSLGLKARLRGLT